ncbi:hypothetical protein GY45DRAFT_866053 [Cubamyces sp. BRFM 1775]|nr:hypothetical protein GY45DRAFT_866053 [Cubamyces sp. BRFM 1775]
MSLGSLVGYDRRCVGYHASPHIISRSAVTGVTQDTRYRPGLCPNRTLRSALREHRSSWNRPSRRTSILLEHRKINVRHARISATYGLKHSHGSQASGLFFPVRNRQTLCRLLCRTTQRRDEYAANTRACCMTYVLDAVSRAALRQPGSCMPSSSSPFHALNDNSTTTANSGRYHRHSRPSDRIWSLCPVMLLVATGRRSIRPGPVQLGPGHQRDLPQAATSRRRNQIRARVPPPIFLHPRFSFQDGLSSPVTFDSQRVSLGAGRSTTRRPAAHLRRAPAVGTRHSLP